MKRRKRLKCRKRQTINVNIAGEKQNLFRGVFRFHAIALRHSISNIGWFIATYFMTSALKFSRAHQIRFEAYRRIVLWVFLSFCVSWKALYSPAYGLKFYAELRGILHVFRSFVCSKNREERNGCCAFMSCWTANVEIYGWTSADFTVQLP